MRKTLLQASAFARKLEQVHAQRNRVAININVDYLLLSPPLPSLLTMPMAYLTNLDGIRAIAVLLVVVSHLLLQLTNGGEPALYSFRTMGRVGVAIFFVHTTLVLMASLERHGPAAMPFYVRRLFRIYPLSMIIVLLFALLQLAAHVPIDAAKLLSNLLLIQNITGHTSFPRPLWSLPYEVQMYLVLPVLYLLTKTRRPLTWLGLVYLSSVLLALTLPSDSLASKLTLYVPCFLPGVLAFALSGREQVGRNPALLFGLIAIAGVLGIPMLVAARVPEMPLLWGLCIAIGLTIPACRQFQYAFLANASHLIAKYSYGIYITHVLALGAIDGLVPGPAVVQWAAMLVLLPGLAYICYHGIEKHGVALGVRLTAKVSRPERENLSSVRSGDQAGNL
jgi:peptidoglycan/LPS O-acetylase OafA/YrhL